MSWASAPTFCTRRARPFMPMHRASQPTGGTGSNRGEPGRDPTPNTKRSSRSFAAPTFTPIACSSTSAARRRVFANGWSRASPPSRRPKRVAVHSPRPPLALCPPAGHVACRRNVPVPTTNRHRAQVARRSEPQVWRARPARPSVLPVNPPKPRPRPAAWRRLAPKRVSAPTANEAPRPAPSSRNPCRPCSAVNASSRCWPTPSVAPDCARRCS